MSEPFLSNFFLLATGEEVAQSGKDGNWKRAFPGQCGSAFSWDHGGEAQFSSPALSKPENTQKKVHQMVMPKSKVESIQAAIFAPGPDPDSTEGQGHVGEAREPSPGGRGKPQREGRGSESEGLPENLRTSRRGVAGGPFRDDHRARPPMTPQVAVDQVGRPTALSKPDVESVASLQVTWSAVQLHRRHSNHSKQWNSQSTFTSPHHQGWLHQMSKTCSAPFWEKWLRD